MPEAEVGWMCIAYLVGAILTLGLVTAACTWLWETVADIWHSLVARLVYGSIYDRNRE